MTTICVRCRFVSIQNDKSKFRWYNYFCLASPLELKVDPVDGVEKADNPSGFAYCRDINEGNCPKFEEAK